MRFFPFALLIYEPINWFRRWLANPTQIYPTQPNPFPNSMNEFAHLNNNLKIILTNSKNEAPSSISHVANSYNSAPMTNIFSFLLLALSPYFKEFVPKVVPVCCYVNSPQLGGEYGHKRTKGKSREGREGKGIHWPWSSFGPFPWVHLFF
jgi:hypothetical protein